jgi:hypothetical protein
VLCFWDVPTGAPLGEWDLGAPADGGGMIDDLAGSETGRYLAVEYDPDYGRIRRTANPITDWLARAFGTGPPPDPRHILLLDMTERRQLARLPGQSAAFSRNGRWLATLDGAGVVRVWEVPLQPPLVRIMGYSAAAGLACSVGLVLLRRLGPTVVGLRRGQSKLGRSPDANGNSGLG